MTSFLKTVLRDVTYVWNTATEAATAIEAAISTTKTAVATATTIAVNKKRCFCSQQGHVI